MLKNLTKEEETKIKDFMDIYRKYLNPNYNNEIDTIIDYVVDSLIKVYIEYKYIIPFVSVADDSYSYYILKPIEGKYNLLDYLINTAIQNLDAIELVDNKMVCNYNKLKKKMFINKKNVMSLHNSVFDTMRNKIDKDKYLKLYYKNALYHEIGHMLHYKPNNIKEHTIYVPVDYLTLSKLSLLKKRINLNDKKSETENQKIKIRALEKIKERISMYSVLRNKYSILNPEEINDCNVEVERPKFKQEEIVLPPNFYINPIDEAFTECDAQVYSGMFENDIFAIDDSENLNGFYLPIDNEHILMTYSPTTYAFSSSIGFALKECISKLSYFRTVFLGKEDLFLEFLGKYDISVSLLSHRLICADNNQMNEVQPLLDFIVEFYKNKGKSLENLNIYFPLVYKDNKWAYYTESIDRMPPNVLNL